jgi:hypothetical protein
VATTGSGKYGYGAIPPRVNGYRAGPGALPSSVFEILKAVQARRPSEGLAAVAHRRPHVFAAISIRWPQSADAHARTLQSGYTRGEKHCGAGCQQVPARQNRPNSRAIELFDARIQASFASGSRQVDSKRGLAWGYPGFGRMSE